MKRKNATIWTPLAMASAAIVAAGLLAGAAAAQDVSPQSQRLSREDQIVKKVRLDQKLGAQVPLDVQFKDETGQLRPLRSFYHGKPVMMILIQFRCRMLCTEEMKILADSLKQLKFNVGDQFDLLTVSIDDREQPALGADAKAHYLEEYARPGAEKGWHFLTGDKPSIMALADSIGFHFVYDPRTDQFAHPDGVILTTPQGKVSHYFFRLNYDPRDLRLGLVEAANGKVGTFIDGLALLCYHYNPSTGRFSLEFLKLVRLAGIATVVLIAGGVLMLNFRDWQVTRKRNATEATEIKA